VFKLKRLNKKKIFLLATKTFFLYHISIKKIQLLMLKRLTQAKIKWMSAIRRKRSIFKKKSIITFP
jgi:hypothetical protein